ncbi:M20 family metallo-hydrolase [Spirosoma endbachense]|uniref:Hydantoinase/carbamoylase family amidase n=1 Tax=Spirosoma endbachense TaxID=2666025 RepID=A0A6P1W2V7_9BACT|nr:M20 family metallo-hydrolase [Spirosoma endbachense]QHV99753.1 hydantoinase/carbamoylase family amidase [Spirosoma endbachense]
MKNTLLVCLFLVSSVASAQVQTTNLKINQQRIQDRLLELSKIGALPNGGVGRVGYSKADQEGRAYFMGLMKKAGLVVTVDYAGNIIGRRKGKNPALKPIAFGSHIDSVPNGGNYDGPVGSISGLELIETLNENNIITEHPLELIIFANEEGGTIGSGAIIGKITPLALKSVTQSGLTIADGIRAIGGNPDSLSKVVRKKGDLTAFIELHIEQGGILMTENLQIGVVEGIVGIEHWDVTIEGAANHAGTTPMNSRRDALLAAAKLIVALNEVVTSHEGRQVGTVGKIAIEPGAYNVIPGKVVLGIEIRDLSYDKIWKLFHEVEGKAQEIAKTSETTITFEKSGVPVTPALTAKPIQDKIIGAAKSLGLSYRYMQSGAGHDSQEMAQIAPVGMIFIPSVGGISHSPKEFSKGVDIGHGANVLLQTMLAIDRN